MLLDVGAHQPLDVVGQVVGGQAQALDRPPEAGLVAEASTEVHLEALHVVAVGVQGPDALEPDVGHLDPGARVGAAVDVDRQRQVVLRQSGLELVDEVGRARLRLDDGELAVLDAGARHRVAAERSDVVDLEPDAVQPVRESVDADRDDVEDDDLLLRGQRHAARAGGLGEVGQRREA